ncbi:YebG family protein, partial [Oleiphilus sp. HI0125]
ADNLATFIQAKGVDIDDGLLEDLSVLLSKNKEKVAKLFKGVDAESLLEEEKAEVVKLETKQA